MSGKAQSLKEKGNTYFKHGRMLDAANFYAQAEEVDPTDPVFPSNLSAALYESGDYSACLDAICRAWAKSLGSNSREKLGAKLATRMAKALAQGVRTRTVSDEVIELNKQPINELEEIAAGGELGQLRDDWHLIHKEAGNREQNAHTSLTRLSRLPMMRKPIVFNPEFFHIGTDALISLVDGWSPTDPHPLPLSTYTPEQLSNLAFLLAGVGDGRHIFGTLIGMHRASRALSKSKRSHLKFHLTGLDIHPQAIARDLVMLLLLDDLVEGKHSKEVQVEIKATFFYIFAAPIMPPYCHQRMMATMEDLKIRLSEDPPRLPSWLHVVSDSIPAIYTALDYWLEAVHIKDIGGMLDAHEYLHPGVGDADRFRNTPGVSQKYKDDWQTKHQARKDEASAFLDSAMRTDADVARSAFHKPGQSIRETRNWIRDNKDTIIATMLGNQHTDSASGSLVRERSWYLDTSTFFPPTELLQKRHPAFLKLRKEFENDHAVIGPLAEKVGAEIGTTWEPNISLFDMLSDEERSRYESGYPMLKMDFFSCVGQFQLFYDEFDLGKGQPKINEDCASYEYLSRVFSAAGEAIKAMKGRFKVEMLCGELNKELSKMKFRSDFTRPEEFPRNFARVWLSNIPDFTHGLINTAVFVVPNLQNIPEAAIASNVMLNTGAFKDDNEFIHTYTLLEPNDVHRYLGCRLIRTDAIHGFLVVAPIKLPLALKDLASREELDTWLTRQVLHTMVPGFPITRGPFRIRFTNNLVAFIGLLVHLHSVGFPAHWLSEFLHAVIHDKLTTDITPAHELPIPVSDIFKRVSRRKVRVGPWLADLECTLAVTHQGLPFAVSLPSGFARSGAEIGTYEASVKSCSDALGFMRGNYSPYDCTTCLMFWKPSASSPDPMLEGMRFAMLFPKLLEPNTQIPANVTVLTAQDEMDLEKKIKWKMSRERMKVMKAEKWVMMAFRADFKTPETIPVVSTKWIEVA